MSQTPCRWREVRARAYHLCRFSASYRELQIGIFLPVTEQKWELGEKAIIGVARSGDGLGVGVAVDAPFKGLCSANQFFPSFEVIGIVKLKVKSVRATIHRGVARIMRVFHAFHTSSTSSFPSSAFSSSEPP